MDDKAKRRLSLRRKTNDELFLLYYHQLKVRLTHGQFGQYKLLLDKFHQSLGQFPPSVELATRFLAQYANHAPLTLARYTGIIRGIMEWYGETLNLKPPATRPLPQYVDPGDVDRLIEVIGKKKNHKRTITRDILLVKFDRMTGLRAGELSRLTVGDIRIQDKAIMVRKGKGGKDRVIPLHIYLVDQMADFIKDMRTTDSVFGLETRSITDKISTWSKKAGIKLHTHSLRHHFAEQLLESGAEITVVQKLMGYNNLQTTAAYLGLRPGSMQNAVDKLGTSNENSKDNSTNRETPHTRTLRRVAKLLAGSISLTSNSDKSLWKDFPLEFKPGEYHLSIGNVEIDKDKQIRVTYPDVGAGIAESYLLRALRTHLGNCGLPKYAEIAGDNGKLNDLTGKAGQYSKLLLVFLKKIADEVNRAKVHVNFRDDEKLGVTRWFIITIWNDAIQRARGHYWIDDSWYKPYERLHGVKRQLRCGPNVIGIANSENTLDAYYDLHKRLRTKYIKDPLAKKIHDTDQEMSNLAQEIIVRLHEFVDNERLPGRCELCGFK